jgi:thioesterase domain-containing protein
MAAVYTGLIETRLDDGPCILVGHSFTGLLAFEVAHQLAANGRRVEMVILLDAWAKNPPWWWRLASLTSARARQVLSERTTEVRSGFDRILPRTKNGDDPADCSYQSIDEMSWNVFLRLIRHTLKGYRLQPLDTRAVLFRARESHKAHLHAYDPTLGWDGLFSRGMNVMEVAGDHSTILLGPNLPVLARLIHEQLRSILGNKTASARRSSDQPALVAQ